MRIFNNNYFPRYPVFDVHALVVSRVPFRPVMIGAKLCQHHEHANLRDAMSDCVNLAFLDVANALPPRPMLKRAWDAVRRPLPSVTYWVDDPSAASHTGVSVGRQGGIPEVGVVAVRIAQFYLVPVDGGRLSPGEVALARRAIGQHIRWLQSAYDEAMHRPMRWIDGDSDTQTPQDSPPALSSSYDSDATTLRGD